MNCRLAPQDNRSRNASAVSLLSLVLALSPAFTRHHAVCVTWLTVGGVQCRGFFLEKQIQI